MGYEALVRGVNGESASSVLSQVGPETRYRFDQAARVMVVGIARALNIAVLAEGVESDAERTVLRAFGISLFQGYHFAKPALMSLPTVGTPEVTAHRRAS